MSGTFKPRVLLLVALTTRPLVPAALFTAPPCLRCTQRAVPRCFQHLLIKTWPPAQPGWVDELCPQPPFTDGFQSLKPAGVGG